MLATLAAPLPSHPVPSSPPSSPPSPSRVRAALARTEGVRMLRHPALPVGPVLTLLAAHDLGGTDWSGARYQGYVAALGALLWGVSVAAAHAGARARTPLVEDSR